MVDIAEIQVVANPEEFLDLLSETGEFALLVCQDGSTRRTIVKDICNLYLARQALTATQFEAIGRFALSQSSRLAHQDVIPVGRNPNIQMSSCFSRPILEFTLPLALRGVDQRTQSILASFWMSCFGLEVISGAKTYMLSTGQKQRLLLASCLALQPKMLILNGAIDFIDHEFTMRLLPFLRHLSRASRTTILLVTPGESHLIESAVFDRRATIGHSWQRTVPVSPENVERRGDCKQILAVTGLRYRFEGGAELFRGLTFSLKEAHCLVITGRNGSGKSTLGSLLAGALQPLTGSITVFGRSTKELYETSDPQVTCALVDADDVFTRSSVADEIGAIRGGCISNEARRRLLALLGLEQLLGEHPYDLDWLSRRRLGLFLAAASTDAILFIDEPLSLSTDATTIDIREVVLTLLHEGVTVIVATNNSSVVGAMNFAERLDLSLANSMLVKVGQNNGRSIAQIGTGHGVWAASAAKWYAHMAEFSHFWEFRVYPSLSEIIRSLNFKNETTLVDLGCGMGLQTMMVSQEMRRCGLSINRVIGADKQQEFVELAKTLFSNQDGVEFLAIDIASSASTASLIEKLDGQKSVILTSFFSLHDLPSLNGIKQILCAIGSSLTAFLAVIVSPEFADAHLERSSVKTVDTVILSEEKSHDFEWVCDFPLTVDGLHGFVVPYFHRSTDFYVKELGEHLGFEIKYQRVNCSTTVVAGDLGAGSRWDDVSFLWGLR